MQISSAYAITPSAPGSGVDTRQLVRIATVFASEGNQSFETKRAAWLEYQRMVREGKDSDTWSRRMTKEQQDELRSVIEGSDFARSVAAAERSYAFRMPQGYTRNPHEDAIKAADGLSDNQLKYFEVSLLDNQGMTFSEWRDKEGAMSDILQVWRMADTEARLNGTPNEELLEALKTLYEMVGNGKIKSNAFEWPEGAGQFVKLLAKRNASREPQDVVEISPEALAMLRKQNTDALRADALREGTGVRSPD
jgi:hypothetical protein